jgi:hypothetical protein
MEPHTAPNATPQNLADDILRGADEIAEFIFGARGNRRKPASLRLNSASISAADASSSSGGSIASAGKPRCVNSIAASVLKPCRIAP